MGKVVEFPTKQVKTEALMEILDRTIDELDEAYEELDILHHQMHELEKACNQKEYKFDFDLAKYAHGVGVENVPIGLLNFASDYLIIDVESGEIRYEPPEET